MKLVIPFGYSNFLAFPAEEAGFLVPALSTAQFFEKCYKDKTFKALPVEDHKMEFSFEPDERFDAQPEAFVELQKSRDESEKKYLAEWTKGQEYQKQIRELTAKLDALKNTLSPVPTSTSNPSEKIAF